MASNLPYFFEGTVIRGFGRGGKELGCPTANMDDSVVDALPKEFNFGVYYGIAELNGKIYSMAMSVGTNPHYKTVRKTLEVHLIDYHGEDFYAQTIRGLITGFIREMGSFKSLEELKDMIANDIRIAIESTKDEATNELKKKYFTKRSAL